MTDTSEAKSHNSFKYKAYAAITKIYNQKYPKDNYTYVQIKNHLSALKKDFEKVRKLVGKFGFG